MAMLLGIPNSSFIEIGDTANYGYTFEKLYDKKDLRTKGGALFTYIVPQSSFRRFTVPATFVNSQNKSIINSWFSTASDLRFIEDDTFANSFFSVRIVGVSEPYDKYIQPYFRQFYSGTITFETI
tara:strand:- start:444 stop:818 length:375 start_codon:yes stop_codon:yes gene_type:complete